jgi:hypothetical protein
MSKPSSIQIIIPIPQLFLLKSQHLAIMMPERLISITSLLIFNCLVWATAWSTRPLNARYQVVALTRRLTMVEQNKESEEYFVNKLSCCCSNVGGLGIGTGFYRNGFCGKLSVLYVFLLFSNRRYGHGPPYSMCASN